ncbi:hypothetical protein AQS70_14670 [Pseudomonas endophytica]|uniref:Uncharacterized protein n=1 Tax=Pseudomonas endophytica TaxID=1563157 RepID=A0A0Q0XQS6_9PSED|nr:hypothetical protein AQS70_14670 [Pseudomonas endophytica]
MTVFLVDGAELERYLYCCLIIKASFFVGYCGERVLILFLLMILILMFVPVGVEIVSAAFLVAYSAMLWLAFKSPAPEDRGIEQLIDSKRKRQLLVIRSWGAKFFWFSYSALMFLWLLLYVLEEMLSRK